MSHLSALLTSSSSVMSLSCPHCDWHCLAAMAVVLSIASRWVTSRRVSLLSSHCFVVLYCVIFVSALCLCCLVAMAVVVASASCLPLSCRDGRVLLHRIALHHVSPHCSRHLVVSSWWPSSCTVASAVPSAVAMAIVSSHHIASCRIATHVLLSHHCIALPLAVDRRWRNLHVTFPTVLGR